MNKKAIILGFLLALIIGSLLFFGSCSVASKLLRFSPQAKENFADFVSATNDFYQQGWVGQQKNELLILDAKTAVAFYNPLITGIEIFTEGETYFFNRPASCNLDKSCFCLHQDIELEGQVFKSEKAICYDLDYRIEMRECYPPGNEKKIICSNGFVIGREIELIKGARRSNINMIKETDQISLIWK